MQSNPLAACSIQGKEISMEKMLLESMCKFKSASSLTYNNNNNFKINIQPHSIKIVA